jgi:RimJ/RimL family protein N-acetyltransferase
VTSIERANALAAARKAKPLPEQFETERLLLRRARKGDAEPTIEAAMETADALALWMPWAHPAPTREGIEAYFKKTEHDWDAREVIDFQLIEKSTNALVGKAGFHHIDWLLPRVEIGYWLRASRHGEGFATEATRGLVAYAQQHIEAARIEIRSAVNNAQSRAVAERAGFTLEGIMRQNTWSPEPDGVGLRDACMYAYIPTYVPS